MLTDWTLKFLFCFVLSIVISWCVWQERLDLVLFCLKTSSFINVNMNDGDAVMAMLLGVAEFVRSTKMALHLVECWSRDPGSWVEFPAVGLGVAFFATGRGLVLKLIFFLHSNLPYFKTILSVDNECKCQILSLIYTYTSPELLPIYIQNSRPSSR